MLEIDLHELRQLDRLIKAVPDRFEKVLERTTRDLARDTRSEASKAIRDKYAVKVKALNRSGTRGRYLGVRDISFQSMSFIIRGLKFGVPLIEFGGARETRKGVTVTVQRNEKRRLYPQAFIATGPSAGKQVWERQISRSTGKRVGRLPIRRIFGPSVADMLDDQKIAARITEFAGRKGLEILNRRIDRVFARL